MSFSPDTPFHSIPSATSEATFGAVMEMLLKTRMKLNLESNQKTYDEDVNTYMTGVLVSYIDPHYLSAINRVLSKYDVDVHSAADQANTNVEAYRIYKVNADDILVSLGIFQGLWQKEKGDVLRLRRYYAHASEFQRRIYGKLTAVGTIQTKLAEDPERYLTILASAKQDYLHFMEQTHQSEALDQRAQMDQLPKLLEIQSKQDELLDLYSHWLENRKDPDLSGRLGGLVAELVELDPHFNGDLIFQQLKSSQAA